MSEQKNVQAVAAQPLLAAPPDSRQATRWWHRLGWLRARSVWLIALLYIALLAGCIRFYGSQEQQARAAVEADLSTISGLKREQIIQWRGERLADAAVLMDSPLFTEGVARWLAAPSADLAEKILHRFRSMQQHNGYQDVLLVDNQGQVRLSLSGQTSALHATEMVALTAALREAAPVLSDLHFDSNSQVPHANLVAPLSIKVAGRQVSQGAIILNVDARQVLFPLIESWPATSTSAETLLVRRDGGDVLFLNNVRHHPDSALQLRLALNRREVPAVMVVLGKTGVFRGIDYRGVPVLSVLSPIPDSPWFMVSKIDESEALATWHLRAGVMVLAGMLATLALSVATWLVWQRGHRVKQLQRTAAEVQKANRAYRVLSQCNQTLVHATNEQQLLDRICTLLVAHGGYRCAWVGYAQDDANKSVLPVAEHGFEAGYIQSLHLSWGNDERGHCPTGSAIRSGQNCVARSTGEGIAYDLWRDGAARHGYASSISLPLSFNGAVGGALSIYADDPEAFTAQETMLLREMADDLAFGVRTLRGQIKRQQEQDALALERSKLTAAFANVNIGLVLCDAQGGHITMNSAALRFHGFASAQDMGQRLQDYATDWQLRYLDGQPMPYAQWPLARALRGECVTNYDVVLHQAKTQFETVCSYTSALVRNQAGEVTLIVMTLLDISDRIRAEQEVRQLNASLEQRVTERTLQLEEANHAKSDFLANMSHELRTPLNAIIGFSEILKDGVLGPLDARQQDFVGNIFGAGQHLLALINDILDLSKVEAGTLQLEATAIDVPALLLASMMVVREKATAHGISLDSQLDPALGGMLADARKLKQIVYNLLSNAVKFTPKGGRVMLLTRRCQRQEIGFDEAMPSRLIDLPPGEDAEFLEIAIEDTGAGIALADLGKLYQPFMQVDTSLARRHAGTGLGLSLVRSLAALHGGTVGVASQPGMGSRFCVWLPYREAVLTPNLESVAALPAFASAPPAPNKAPPLALMVGNDDQVADMIAAQLHAEGCQVMRAATGEEALARAAKRCPQLITLDIFLPAMDGWEFLRRLKADVQLTDTPVVIISLAQGLERGLVLGARRVLQKPFQAEELAQALAGLVQMQGSPARDGLATGLRVLVVDDNARAVELVATLLQAEGHQVLRAYSGMEAIHAARLALPDLVILDLMMPEVSGFEVARALRSTAQTARIPILVLTAMDLTVQEREQLSANVSTILKKSDFSHDQLRTELRRAMAVRQAN